MQDLLALVDELRDFSSEATGTQTIQGQVRHDKWLLRSALQKAVRRGQTETARCVGDQLSHLEPDYFWNALAVIAVEDIGFGDPDLITFTTAAKSKTVRKAVGDDEALSATILTRLCAAPKSRACCELSIAVELGRPDLVKAARLLSDEELLRTVQEGTSSSTFIALGLLRGALPGIRGRGDHARAAAEEVIAERLREHPAIKRAALHAFRRPSDSMSVATLSSHLLTQCGEIEVVDEAGSWPPSEIINGIDAAAYDIHTRVGRRALSSFYNAQVAMHPWLAQIGATAAPRALGAALFIEEGGMVDRRITNTALGVVREAQDKALLLAWGVPDHLGAPLRTRLTEEVVHLHAVRRWCASG